MSDGGAERRGRAARIGFVAGPLAFALALLVPLPDLSLRGAPVVAAFPVRVVLGLAAWMAFWWMTEALPLAATALLPLAVLPVLKVLPVGDVAPAYFDETIALFLGGFCLALAMERSGLHRRFAHGVVRRAGTSPRRLVFGFFAASGLVSMWVSNTATTLMMMPVAVTVLRAVLPGDAAARSQPERNFAACVVLAVAYGASIGGVGTLVGSPPNMIFRGVYNGEVADATGAPEATFGRWLVIGVPLVVVLIPLAWWTLTRVVLPVPRRLRDEDDATVLSRVAPEGRTTFAEGAVLAVFLATAFAWITREPIDVGAWRVPLTGWGDAFTTTVVRDGRVVRTVFVRDGTVAVLAALLLFLLPSRRGRGDRILTWEYAERHVPWGALLLFGGGFALAKSFEASGLNSYLAASFQGLGGLPHWALLTIVAFGMTALSEVANNTAATNMMLPVLLALATGIGADPLPILLVATLGASCGFALPIATMPNTVAYGTGEVSVGRMGRAGLVLDVLATAVMVLATLLLAPLAFPRS